MPDGKPKISSNPDVVLTWIGLRIRRRREALDLSQRALAERVGMAQGNLNRIEHGEQNLTVRTMCRLAEALEMTLGELVTGTPPAED